MNSVFLIRVFLHYNEKIENNLQHDICWNFLKIFKYAKKNNTSWKYLKKLKLLINKNIAFFQRETPSIF